MLCPVGHGPVEWLAAGRSVGESGKCPDGATQWRQFAEALEQAEKLGRDLFAPGLPLAIHCNVCAKVTKEYTFDEPRHWIMLGHGRGGQIIWDFPGPFLRPAPGKPPRSGRGPPPQTE
jgi:hypothetical protein